ncbi:MAG: helix-turn-helix domain-containing protein [Hydrotalea flava]|uniref:Crp/Fnr family transcriptional regulator n=1 Tax=Hydrotalea sp. TaxID=2881279 RepID=UPI00169B5DF4|nr:Crp/Fnr family transcriptional regulator [Hydrotalea sp.]NIM34337.1 helix-turn-helix domain-containing protein [Hydrotalea flava]NIM37163.1 helix-turn-helix domain-containing protein [Hydrotalea flava]NIN02356.1 helix-turn-helix domain-containing protein [Hydrotalea flava]NIN14008.1 helix-turn-helix domain-containing protein [Hydrotalea flava]NIO93089.1 helix-turn-helix domain-containing protein [Hydrotalea flava]
MQPLYKMFPQLEPALLQEIEANSILKTIPADEILIRTGQYIKSALLVVEGTLKIFRENEDGGEFLMYYLQPGEACAISLVCASKMEASKVMVKSVEESIIMMVPIHLMDQWMSKYKSWYYYVLETYRNRFEELLLLIDHIAFRNMDERLIFYLKRYSKAHKSNQINVSHQQIADELNSSREVISRLLKKLEQKNLLSLSRNTIELKETFHKEMI